MLVIDALNIRIGGGAVLLNYFVCELQKQNKSFLSLTNDTIALDARINSNARSSLSF